VEEKMDKHSMGDRIEKIALAAAVSHGVELVHTDIGGTKRDMVVRIFIDKPGGVSVEDCSDVSRAIEATLDEEDFIPSHYVLEVSSPGIERELYSAADFAKFAGRQAKVKMEAGIDGQKTFTGTIIGVEGEEIVFEDKTRGPIRFMFGDVAKANLRIDLTEEFKRR
jgi:ribosome maturation factor RimP